MKHREIFWNHVNPLQSALEAYACRMLHAPSQREDVLQEALKKAFEKFDVYHEGTNFRAWIFKFLSHEIMHANRRHEQIQQIETSLEKISFDLAAELDQALDYDQMLNQLDHLFETLDEEFSAQLLRLPPLERGVLLLNSVGGLTYQEIHDALDIPTGSVLGYLSRAKAKLRKELLQFALDKGLIKSGDFI